MVIPQLIRVIRNTRHTQLFKLLVDNKLIALYSVQNGYAFDYAVLAKVLKVDKVQLMYALELYFMQNGTTIMSSPSAIQADCKLIFVNLANTDMLTVANKFVFG